MILMAKKTEKLPENPFILVKWEDFFKRCDYRSKESHTDRYLCGRQGVTENPEPLYCDYMTCPYISFIVKDFKIQEEKKPDYIR